MVVEHFIFWFISLLPWLLVFDTQFTIYFFFNIIHICSKLYYLILFFLIASINSIKLLEEKATTNNIEKLSFLTFAHSFFATFNSIMLNLSWGLENLFIKIRLNLKITSFCWSITDFQSFIKIGKSWWVVI